MKLAIIPARGGSKRIPYKNIKEFCGRPMVAWSIEAAKETKLFDKIVVSTDDLKIANISKRYGAEVPFMRPECLSDDYTGTTQVVEHAVRWHMDNNILIEYVCCIYATAPMLQPKDIVAGFAKLIETEADFTLSIASYAFPIQRALRLSENKRVSMFDPTQFENRSQDLIEAYHDAGQFYWGKTDAWLSEKPLFDSHTSAVILPRYRVQDIDTPEDWEHAELLFKTLHSNNFDTGVE